MDSAILEALFITAVVLFSVPVMGYVMDCVGGLSSDYELIADVQNFIMHTSVSVVAVADGLYAEITVPEEIGVTTMTAYYVNGTSYVLPAGSLFVFNGTGFVVTNELFDGTALYRIDVPSIENVSYVLIRTTNVYKWVLVSVGQ